MATVLGKRKSRLQKADPSISQEEAQAKLAKFFEASFKPLFPTAQPAQTPKPEEEVVPSSDGSDDESWGGFSEDEAEEDEEEDESPPPVVEVVSHTDAYSRSTNTLDKRESRAWLSSRPPLPAETDPSSSKNKKGKTSTTDEEDAPSLLKNDLALQRLLAESHLFSAAAARNGGGDGGDATEHVGRNRHLATDLRLVALGSKSSIHKQAKMPMAFRKGIQAAAEGREVKRRREARENGVVLERFGAASTKTRGRRGGSGSSRDIDAPAVGRMRNGMLRLSRKDISDIEGGSRKGGGFTRKRRR
ncbi:hypothetical protein F4861DRAFT_224139 [Xylaria intraflava]|nr:hypothetical protein F4861DRAFT_224139 [Xylaria intraflava]